VLVDESMLHIDSSMLHFNQVDAIAEVNICVLRSKDFSYAIEVKRLMLQVENIDSNSSSRRS